MLKTVEGTYRNGTITLDEVPVDVKEAKVIVTFLAGSEATDGKETWLSVCGVVSDQDADEMPRAIEEGCKRVDPEG